MNRLLIFFFLIVFASQAQTDSVRLVDIQSSGCCGMYTVKPGFVNKETVGDTTFIQLFCSNNCGGYNSPDVTLIGDSVFISIHAGEKSMKPFVNYKVNGEIYSEDDLIDRERRYDKKYSRTDTVMVMEEVHMLATCNCCYNFELKIVGLDSLKSYNYFYNGQYIDPAYKATGEIKEYYFPYFLEAPQYEVFKKLKKIVYKSRNKDLLKELKSFHLWINITADTINYSIAHIEIEHVNKIKNIDLIDKKITDYLMSIPAMILVRNHVKKRWIKEYIIFFGFNWENGDQLEMTFDAGERMSD